MTELVEKLVQVVGDKHVLVESAAQQRFLRDFSWYSPVLADAFINTRIDAVVQPATLAELDLALRAARLATHAGFDRLICLPMVRDTSARCARNDSTSVISARRQTSLESNASTAATSIS